MEEPPRQTLFLLVSENPELLLETIRSRTQRIDFKKIETAEMEKALTERRALEPDMAHRIARIANGNAGLIDINVNQKMLCQGVQSGKIDMRDYSQFIMIGQPNEGQSLDEVKAIMLGEIEKLKRGEFSDKLLPSVKNNMKLEFLRSLDSNESPKPFRHSLASCLKDIQVC